MSGYGGHNCYFSSNSGVDRYEGSFTNDKAHITKIIDEVNKGTYCNMTLYKFLGFKEALTEEQMQAVIKKYNLLDGVDEIEVS